MAPTDDDPAFTVSRIQEWYLVGDDVTPGSDDLEVEVSAPAGTEFVDVWVSGQPGVRLNKISDGTFGQVIDISSLDYGEHEVLLAADGSDTAFARRVIKRTAPLYVIVTTDWDDADTKDFALGFQDDLHSEHPHLKLTHFVGPYTFTDSTVTAERVGVLTDWVKLQRDTFGDEIGLHIHPYCNFVTYAGVTCRTEPSTVYANGDTTGYTIMVSAYTEQEFTTLLETADDLFMAHGMGKPTAFRAGGWTADLSTLRALNNAGYVVDASANNWARMEEWQGQNNGVLYDWNMEHWAPINDTSQPYYPSDADILQPGSPAVGVLEVPDNGILVDYVTTDEMIEIFDENWDGSVLNAPVQLSIGYHPSNFVFGLYTRITDAMTYIDQFLAANGAGPVVYTTLSDMTKVWKPAN